MSKCVEVGGACARVRVFVRECHGDMFEQKEKKKEFHCDHVPSKDPSKAQKKIQREVLVRREMKEAACMQYGTRHAVVSISIIHDDGYGINTLVWHSYFSCRSLLSYGYSRAIAQNGIWDQHACVAFVFL